ncbi:MAG TPA: 3',5'-cyclic-nucleotide phosphodiesterase [Blastocatellia bacterium]|nr:3',5'-cyclic-nucleotide phosphodiesterase [Blastocatellia bacterium]
MKVRLLPSAAGRASQLQALTSFLVNDCLAVDAGSLGFALRPEEMGRIRHAVITHAHSDHMASLPIYVAEAYTVLDGPVFIYGLDTVVEALHTHVFNDEIWPDFRKITLPASAQPTIEFRALVPHETVEIAGLRVTPIPVNHVVPNVGLIIEDDHAAVVFTSDTYCTDALWAAAKERPHLRAVFVDVSFPNELGWLAEASKHLTPELLAAELRKLDRDVEVYAVHIKPTNREQVIRELGELGLPKVGVGEVDRVYEW